MNRIIASITKHNIVGIYDGERPEINEKIDVIIDFSHPDYLDETLALAKKYKSAIVIGTTNYNNKKKSQIKEISNVVPVVMADNYSPGITLIAKMLKQNKKLISKYNVYVAEMHHKQKLDSPSGTAKYLASILNTNNIQAYRMGNIIGVHEVFLASDEEVITIKHEVSSRRVFALGALKAANLIINKKNGFYTFEELMENEN